MRPKEKIVDAQELARFIDKAKKGAGAYDQHEPVVKVSDLMAWLIGANNHVQHKHGRFVNEFWVYKNSDPELVVATVDRDEFLLFDGKSLREEARKLIDS